MNVNNVNLKLVIATTRFYNLLLSKIEKEIQGFDLNISEFGVLEMLLHKGEQPVQKIAEGILVTSGTMSYVIDKLQKRDFVYRKNCEKDKRVFYICLTETGAKYISDIFPKHKQFIDDLFSCLDYDFKKELTANLFTMQDSLNNGQI